jgi:SAM-dependent methyltransferase
MLDRDQIIWAYRYFFGREPESEAAIEQHRQWADWESLRHAFLNSKEFKSTHPEHPGSSTAGRHALARAIHVELTGDQGDLSMMFQRVGESWKRLGESEPHWSVVTAEQFKSDRIKQTEEVFYATGQQDTELIKAFFARNKLPLDSVQTCLEFGCGVGRATAAISEIMKRVHAVDISAPHLELARVWLNKINATNVDLIQLRSIPDIETLPEFDLLYSIIVFQHNPPPVIAHIMDILFSKVRRGGYVLFQVPTYRSGYSFRWKEYLSNSRHEMEMHVLPQSDVFRLFRKHKIATIEVQEDGLTGSDLFLSNTFFGRREEA